VTNATNHSLKKRNSKKTKQMIRVRPPLLISPPLKSRTF
jgi:hypothetical protein